MGGSFSATNRVLPIPGGVVHGGSFSATNRVLPIPVGGLSMGGGSFSATNHVLPIPAGKARPTGLDFRGIAPECVYRFSGDGGEAVWPDPGILVQDPPARPF